MIELLTTLVRRDLENVRKWLWPGHETAPCFKLILVAKDGLKIK